MSLGILAGVAGCAASDETTGTWVAASTDDNGCESAPPGDIAPEPTDPSEEAVLTAPIEYSDEPNLEGSEYNCKVDIEAGDSDCAEDMVRLFADDDSLAEWVAANGRAAVGADQTQTAVVPPSVAAGPGFGLVAAVNMGEFRQMDVYAYTCDPRGWALHVSDSPTADGYGGDSGLTDHDAEGYLYAGGPNDQWARYLNFYSTYDMVRGVPGSRVVEYDASSRGCAWIRMTFYHDRGSPTSCFFYQSPTTTTYARTLHGPKLGYSACASATSPQRSIECDRENASLSDSFRWYLGANRTVGSGSRWGSGVYALMISLSRGPTNLPGQCLQ